MLIRGNRSGPNAILSARSSTRTGISVMPVTSTAHAAHVLTSIHEPPEAQAVTPPTATNSATTNKARFFAPALHTSRSVGPSPIEGSADVAAGVRSSVRAARDTSAAAPQASAQHASASGMPPARASCQRGASRFATTVTPPRAAEQLAGELDDARARRACIGDRDAAATPHLDQALVAQRRIRAQHGMHVDGERRCELARRRQLIARSDLAARDRTAHLRGDLLVQVRVSGGVDPDQQ